MKKITCITGKAIPLNRSNVDTDLIIPAQYLTSISATGYGEHLFQRLRDSDPDFVFNQPQFKGATVLIANENFGCGSSREHAVWALQQAGIEAIIAVSFADIFSNNAAKNGLVLIQQPTDVITSLLNNATVGDYTITVDVEKQQLSTLEHQYDFTLDPFHRHCFINGIDELDYLLSQTKREKP